MTDAIKNIHQRLAEVMRAVTYIQKEKKSGMNYTITSHDAVTAKVRPALLDAGIVYYPVRCEHTHNGNRAECGMTIRFVNIDEPSDFFEVQTFGYGVDPQDKGPGKAMSYAVKYALLKALGLETGDDADHDEMNHSKEDPATPKPAPKPVARDPRAVADWIIARVSKARTADEVDAVTGDAKVSDAREWLYEEHKALNGEVNEAVNEARNRMGEVAA
jgi:hypothetical protein